jgi:hypothetical protein
MNTDDGNNHPLPQNAQKVRFQPHLRTALAQIPATATAKSNCNSRRPPPGEGSTRMNADDGNGDHALGANVAAADSP